MNRLNAAFLTLVMSVGCVERNPYYQGDEAATDGGAPDGDPVASKDGAFEGGDGNWPPPDGQVVFGDGAVLDAAPLVDGDIPIARDRGPSTDADMAAPATDGGQTGVDVDEDGVPTPLDCADDDPDVYPGAPERCDGEDQDCDGRVDEDFDVGEPCDVGVGACERTGALACVADDTAACDATPGQPVVEVCNGQDDDCDGAPDEGTLNRCGGCGDDLVERCNGLDDDCDDEIDEEWDLGAVCFDGQGACRRGGVVVCGGEMGTQCSAVAAEPSDEVCNGLDDDCDAFMDEALGVGEPCTVGVGACARDGVAQCSADGGVQCSAMVGPREMERCNRVDDDCDGSTDESFPLGQVCFVGEGACRLDGRTVCAEGGDGVICLTPDPMFEDEVCDREDNDCDGQVDEGLLNACGVCGPQPQEICDGADNDCDGTTDEGVLNACGECGAVPDERCDAQDQDCDGQVDEGLAVCVVGLGSIAADDEVEGGGFGAVLADAGDLTGDGVPDLYVAAPEGEGGSVTLVDGQRIQRIWSLRGDEGFGTAIVAYRFAAGVARTLVVGSPAEGRDGTVYLYSPEGEQLGRFGGDGNVHAGKVLVGSDGSPILGMADPDQGLLDNGAIRLLDPNVPDEELTLDGELGEQLGERLFICPDLDRDAIPELLASVRFNFLRDRGAVIYGSANFGQRSDRIQSAQQTSRFGQGFTAGDYAGDGRTVLVFGDPGSDRNRGQIYFLANAEFLPRTLRTGQRNDGQGHVLLTLPRAGEPDHLIVGSDATDSVEIWRLSVRNDGDFAIDENFTVTREGVQMSFGRALVLSEPAAGGTRRLFIGEPDANRGRGAIHVFSIR